MQICSQTDLLWVNMLIPFMIFRLSRISQILVFVPAQASSFVRDCASVVSQLYSNRIDLGK